MVGIGFDAEAVAHFEASGTRQFGRIGLFGPVIRALVSHSDSLLRVTTNGGSSEAEWVIVTRVQRYAGGLLLEPGRRHHPNKILRGAIWWSR